MQSCLRQKPKRGLFGRKSHSRKPQADRSRGRSEAPGRGRRQRPDLPEGNGAVCGSITAVPTAILACDRTGAPVLLQGARLMIRTCKGKKEKRSNREAAGGGTSFSRLLRFGPCLQQGACQLGGIL